MPYKNPTEDELLRLVKDHYWTTYVLHDKHHNRWKINGQPKIWKRSGDWQIPLKHGMYDFGYLTNSNFDSFHWPSECGDLPPYAEEKAAAIAEAASEKIRKEAEQKAIRRFISK